VATGRHYQSCRTGGIAFRYTIPPKKKKRGLSPAFIDEESFFGGEKKERKTDSDKCFRNCSLTLRRPRQKGRRRKREGENGKRSERHCVADTDLEDRISHKNDSFIDKPKGVRVRGGGGGWGVYQRKAMHAAKKKGR